ncbi:tRNA (adenine(22)-N(1))-methyltransferase [Peptoniphilus raoultii]|uniref:tRNA (adenine(22)-N(1))-methyltransferase n=1 Tax=Peptoniphilus raoultii TaxID=1776387 RepID=UPI0008DA59A7|nr:class I SAM-dependent methyltransferase [Peptoniphilus raoultii]
MINLSKRLRALADFCDENKIIADIGTDHGFVPNFLYEEKNTKKIYAVDISKSCLQKSMDFTKLRANERGIDHIISDGLKNVPPADNIIIAGMGGVLITRILERNMEKARAAEKLILQPMQQADFLRKFLYDKAFEILDEKIIYEDKKYFQIIVGRFTGKITTYEKEDLIVPKILRERKDKSLIDFLEDKIGQNNFILHHMDKKSLRAKERIEDLERENKKFKELVYEISK